MQFEASDPAAMKGETTDARDPAIKIFGRTIPLQESPAPAPAEEASVVISELDPASGEKVICQETTSADVKESTGVSEEPEHGKSNSSICLNNSREDNHETFTHDDEVVVDPKPEQAQTEADVPGQEKVLKKPDKILPCPRCNSLETKFCYYNNYNVNQPRHFCKKCQRYWTAGGAMRNVPVGAGRRKNKNSSSGYCHIMMPSDGISIAYTRVDAPDSNHHQNTSCGPASSRPLKVNGTVLKFGAEAPICDSMASILNLQEQKRNADFSSVDCEENKDEPSCASSVTASNCVEKGQPNYPMQMEDSGIQIYYNGVAQMHNMQYYPGSPWAYPWSPGWNNVAAAPTLAGQCPEKSHGPENSNSSLNSWNGQIIATTAFCAPTVPFPFIPASFWGCTPGWIGGPWTPPWVGTNGALSPPSSTSNNRCSGNSSPILGKHPRDISSQVEQKQEKSLWMPKTLRIDDLDQAAKHSIWATLGIQADEGVILKAFRAKAERQGHQSSDATQVLRANPAAFSRSQSFQEST